mmetsp:Transcript_1847/g.2958  ORF Transcript_1847/g.2958 Transcript_1847/m.2958 type:complete len:767 (-) Transcript_1847:21-2321(-)
MSENDNGLHASDGIAVFTSGGDAPGMNAVVRAVLRLGEHYKKRVFAVYEGYQGLVQGGDLIKQLTVNDTRMILHKGGTVIGSARCKEFHERKWRLKACLNLVQRNITNLIVCGGDGSLTGANIFKNEWASLLAELCENGEISEEQAKACGFLNLVGCVGSIDNDMVYSGSLTIGADTALHRIVDAIDSVQSTASSHQRTFVLEIMGRHCGYLAWAAGLATGADFVFIPEAPPSKNECNWENFLCETLDRRRKRGARLCIVLVAEGAVDCSGNPIKSERVKQVIEERLGHDTRMTILGHVQRGGHASAYDRIIGTLCGAMAVEKIIASKTFEPSTIIGLKGFIPTFDPLVETIAATQQVGKLMDKLDFPAALETRGKDFSLHFSFHRAINRDCPKTGPPGEPKTIAIMCSGAPAGGMNAALRASSHYAMNMGYKVLAASGGLEGFMNDRFEPMDWMHVNSWSADGGCNINTDRVTNFSAASMNKVISARNIDGILIIGGFDAFKCVYDSRNEIHVPIALVPATISNNFPGTDFSLGADTALNAVVQAIDTVKKSASSSHSRVFIVETQGRNCGFLAQIAALAGGADVVYTKEEGVTLDQMVEDIARFKHLKETTNKHNFVVVKNEHCSERYNLSFMETLFAEEGKDHFTVRTVKLGHLCQGDYPSPLDRIRGCVFASSAVKFLTNALETGSQEKVVVGERESRTVVQDVAKVAVGVDWDRRLPASEPWSWMQAVQRYIAGHSSTRLDTKYADAVASFIKGESTACET